MTQYTLTNTPIGGGTVSYAVTGKYAVAKLSANLYVKFFVQTAPDHILCQVIQLNGAAAPTVGATTVVNSQSPTTIRAFGIDATTAMVIWDTGTSSDISGQLVTVSGTTPTAGNEVTSVFGEVVSTNTGLFAAWGTTAGNMRLAYMNNLEGVVTNTATYSGNTLTANIAGATEVFDLGSTSNGQANLFVYDVPGTTDKVVSVVAAAIVGAVTFNSSGTVTSSGFQAAATIGSGYARMFPRNSTEYVVAHNTTGVDTIKFYNPTIATNLGNSAFTRISGTSTTPFMHITPLGNDQWMLISTSDASPASGPGNFIAQVMKIADTGTIVMGDNAVTVATGVYSELSGGNLAVQVDNSFSISSTSACAWVDTGTSHDVLIFTAP